MTPLERLRIWTVSKRRSERREVVVKITADRMLTCTLRTNGRVMGAAATLASPGRAQSNIERDFELVVDQALVNAAKLETS